VTDELAQRDQDSLKDPYEQLVEDMRTNPDDAAALAEYVDPAVIVDAFRQINYNVRRKIEVLGEVLKEGTFAEKMKAMKMLDAIRDSSVSRASLMPVNRAILNPGMTLPVGLPTAGGGVESVTIIQTKQTAQMRMRQTILGLKSQEAPAPVQQETENVTQEPAEGDDQYDTDYYADDRGRNPNVFRPARGDHGQQTDIR
jgi:hypothetical protein